MKKGSTIKPLGNCMAPAWKGAYNMKEFNLDIPLGEGCEIWLYTKKKNALKSMSFTRLETSLKMLLRHPVSQVRLKDLNSDCIQRYINSLVQDGYALTTIKKQFNLITSYLRYLMGEGIPIVPSFLNVYLPKQDTVQKPKKEVFSYNLVEQKRLITACENEDTQGARLLILLIETGMRVGEALALRWSDVEWDRRAVYIHSTLINYSAPKRMFVQNSPKSQSSIRHIPLSSRAFRLLERLFDVATDPEGFVFPPNVDDGLDRPIGYEACRYEVTAVCKLANVKYMGFHVFRHTFATNCYNRGCDVKKLSKLMGHSSVTVTYNTYIHLFGDDLDTLRDIVN